MIKRISISLLAITTYVIVVACKSAMLGPNYPITDFNEYDYIVIATVHKAVHDNQGYQPLKTFNATIKRSFKGDLVIGEQINGKAKKEVPRAVCPVYLVQNSDYLLLLTKSSGGYRLSRFSFPVKKGYVYYEDYIKQIKKILAEKK